MMKRLYFLGLVSVLLLAAACGPQQGEESAQMTDETGKATLENGSYDLEVDGRTIHYEVHGTGPACIVLTNSWGFDSTGVRAVFGSLEDMMTMVYFDPRGIGGSSDVQEPTDMSMTAVREDAHAILGELGLDNAMFAGWSNGASNLLLYAAEYPADVKGAIMLHGAAYVSMEFFQEMGQRYPELIQANNQMNEELASEEIPLEEKTARLKEFSLTRFFPAMTADPEATKETLPAKFADAIFSWEHNSFTMQDMFTFDAREQLSQITSPFLVIAGAHDMMPTDMIKQVADSIENSTFVVFENSGHFSPIEEPDHFKTVVKEFLDTIE